MKPQVKQLPSLTDEEQAARLARRFREADAVRLELYLLLPSAIRQFDSEWDGPTFPMALNVAQMLRLLDTSEGRVVCANMARIRINHLPRHRLETLELEVERIFLVEPAGPEAPRHLRFVIDGGAETRCDVAGAPVVSNEAGRQIFASRYVALYC